MKRCFLFVFIIFAMYPLIVKAGIICNDGWESSCIVPGPGCCSHHGGISGGNNSNYYTSDDSLNDNEYTGIIILIIIYGPIVLSVCFNIKETIKAIETKKSFFKEDDEFDEEDDKIDDEDDEFDDEED